MLHMSTKSQIATATTLLLLLFLTLLTTLPHHRVIQIRGMVRAQVELKPVQRVFVQPYQHRVIKKLPGFPTHIGSPPPMLSATRTGPLTI